MIPVNVKQELDKWGLKALEFEEGSTPTSESAAAKIGVAVGAIAKSLVLRGKDGSFAMVLCAGDKRMNPKKLKELAGQKMSMATAEETLRVSGFAPGGVCPFGVRGIPIYVDESLKAYPTVYPAAGNDSSGVPITYAQLLDICGGKTCSVCGETDA
jgi:prolyl-tRNA editing enzyme YbaK/EbsC (Cys-tRNA(Pro) deacylase)